MFKSIDFKIEAWITLFFDILISNISYRLFLKLRRGLLYFLDSNILKINVEFILFLKFRCRLFYFSIYRKQLLNLDVFFLNFGWNYFIFFKILIRNIECILLLNIDLDYFIFKYLEY